MSAVALERPEVVSGRFELSMPEEEYHAHPALSASGMKDILRSPKYFRLQRTAPRSKKEFDEGHAIHAKVLGVGAPIKEIPDRLLSGENRAIQSNAAKVFKAETEAAGFTVLKPAQYAKITRAAEAVLAHPKAKRLLEAAPYREVSLFATDPDTDVPLRARVDALGDLLLDVKSAADVRPRAIERAVVDFGYYVSAAVYRRLLTQILGDDPGPMHLIFIEKEAPFEVAVRVLDEPEWHALGLKKMHEAIDLFASCSEFGIWPGADDEDGPVQSLGFPTWLRGQLPDGEEF